MLGGVSPSAADMTVNDDGCNRWERWYSATARAAGYVGWSNYASTYNPRLIAIANETKYRTVAVVDGQMQSSASSHAPGGAGLANDWVMVKTRGDVTLTAPSTTYTAGHALKIASGAIADTGSAPSGSSDEFGVVLVTVTGTAVEARLFGREILST